MNSAHALDLAVKYHQAGNLGEAEQIYRQILQAEPSHSDALHLLGVIAYQVGRHELAVEHIRLALRQRANFAEAQCNLGAALQALGKLEDAVACFRRAVQLKPDYAEAHNNLGNALRLQGNLVEATVSLQEALRIRPGYPSALTNLGLALQKLGRLDEAVASHEQAVRHAPNHAEAHHNLGAALQDQGKLAEAAASFNHALRLNPNHAEAHNNLGNVRQVQGRLDEALACYERALRLRPEFPVARSNLALVLQQMNDFAGSEQAYRMVLRSDPGHAEALSQLATMLRGKLPPADRSMLEQRLAELESVELSADRGKLLFGLAQVCDATGEYEQAAAHLRRANALALALRDQNGKGYDLEENARFVENLIAAFTPSFFERMRGFGLETERPVFIVGLPRSGTTLTEQILAAHSQVFGAGELHLASADFRAFGKEPTEQSAFAALPGLRRDTVRFQAQRHLDQLSTLNGAAARVVDKMPDNYFYLGLLAVMFPRAKFIHCRRDLRDVAVSCWMTNFLNLRWANDPDHIAARFSEYHRLMRHWRTVLPVSVLEVEYEETVADLPRAARRLAEWCGLDWEPACLAFHESKKPVRNASATQVRQPVHKNSVARWRHYERDLGGLFTCLEPLLDEVDH